MSEPAPEIARRGLCLVLAAPSGAGKGAIGRALLAAEPNLAFSVSATTRQPRPGEQDGVHYHFMDEDGFAALKDGRLWRAALDACLEDST